MSNNLHDASKRPQQLAFPNLRRASSKEDDAEEFVPSRSTPSLSNPTNEAQATDQRQRPHPDQTSPNERSRRQDRNDIRPVVDGLCRWITSLEAVKEAQVETIRRLQNENAELRSENAQVKADLAQSERNNMIHIFGDGVLGLPKTELRLEAASDTVSSAEQRQLPPQSPVKLQPPRHPVFQAVGSSQHPTAPSSLRGGWLSEEDDGEDEILPKNSVHLSGFENGPRARQKPRPLQSTQRLPLRHKLPQMSTRKIFNEPADTHAVINEDLIREIHESIRHADPAAYEEGQAFVDWVNSKEAAQIRESTRTIQTKSPPSVKHLRSTLDRQAFANLNSSNLANWNAQRVTESIEGIERVTPPLPSDTGASQRNVQANHTHGVDIDEDFVFSRPMLRSQNEARRER